MQNNYPTTELEVDINAVMPNKWNPNKMSPKQFENLVAYIKLRGYGRFISVREVAGMYEIIDGEHRWKACKELGMKTIKVHNFGVIPDTVAKEITLNFNALHGDNDIMEEARVLKDLRDAEAGGQKVLFAEDSRLVDEKIELLNFDFKKYQDAELNKEQKEPFLAVMGTVLKLHNLLQQNQNIRGNDDIWMLVQDGIKWCDTMKTIFSKSKKIDVVSKDAPLEGQAELI